MEHFHGHRNHSPGVLPDSLPLATAAITTLLLGWVLTFVGLAQFVFALYSQTIGNFFVKVLLSLLYGICGIALAFFPIAGVAALTGVLGTLLLIQAGLLAATAFQLRPVGGWGWFLFDAATNLLLGTLILTKWPSSSVWAIGTLRTSVVLRKKFGSLAKELKDAELARLMIEAGLIDTVSYVRDTKKGEPLQLAAQVYGVDVAAIRDVAGKEKKSKTNKSSNKKAGAST